MTSKITYKHEDKTSLPDAWKTFKSHAASALARFSRKGPPEGSDETSLSLPPNIGWGVLPVEIYESGNDIEVEIEVAGMKTGDFDITVMGNTLYIEGHKQGRKDSSQGVYHISERAYGYFCRKIAMPLPVDETKVTANYANGVLTVTLPKIDSAFCRRIEVQGD
jgi:HSP20 family protein